MNVLLVLLHVRDALVPADLWRAWTFDMWVILPMIGLTWLYLRGVRNAWSEAGRGRAVSRGQRNAYVLGVAVLVVALVSPLHALGGALFSAHMTQHELLMVVAAPLLVLGAPNVAFAWGLPKAWRRRIALHAGARGALSTWHVLSLPAPALVIHLVVLLMWHAPTLYQQTLTNDGVHAAQHVSFLVSAVAFWWGLLRARRSARGVAVAYLFIAMVTTGLLGALLTLSNSLWYPIYSSSTIPWGLSALDDQRIGGMIMWIPGGATYIVAALWLFAGWLQESPTYR